MFTKPAETEAKQVTGLNFQEGSISCEVLQTGACACIHTQHSELRRPLALFAGLRRLLSPTAKLPASRYSVRVLQVSLAQFTGGDVEDRRSFGPEATNESIAKLPEGKKVGGLVGG